MPRNIKMQPVRSSRSLNFEKIIEPGQNERGFTAQTANGTAKYGNRSGWNRQYDNAAGHEPWPEVPATGAWTQANRTAE